MGGSEANTKVCVPKIGLKFPASLVHFIFPRRKMFLMGGGGRPGLARAPDEPSPPGGVTEQQPGWESLFMTPI